MRLKSCLLVASLVAVAGCTLPPPTPHPGNIAVSGNGSVLTLNRTISVVPGQPVDVGFIHAMQNPDCTPAAGIPPLQIMAQPVDGTLTQQQAEKFPFYAANMPQAKCSQSRTPGIALTYTAGRAGSGTDHFSYRVFTPDGHELISDYTVNITN